MTYPDPKFLFKVGHAVARAISIFDLGELGMGITIINKNCSSLKIPGIRADLLLAGFTSLDWHLFSWFMATWCSCAAV